MELAALGLKYERQRPVQVTYKGLALGPGYRLDLVIEEELIVEIKAIEGLLPVHEAQLLTYLKLTGLPAGLLVNFGAAVLSRGLRRLTNR